MDYKKHYDRLIARSKARAICGYTERHHVIPKCMGGTDEVDNLVDLTAEEHFVAHQLLAKMFPTNKKLIYAAAMMCVSDGKQQRSNKLYSWLKKKKNEALIGSKHSEETKKKMSIARKGRIGPMKGKTHSAETKKILSDISIGKPKSDAARKNMNKDKIGNKYFEGKTHSAETKKKMSDAAKIREQKRRELK